MGSIAVLIDDFACSFKLKGQSEKRISSCVGIRSDVEGPRGDVQLVTFRWNQTGELAEDFSFFETLVPGFKIYTLRQVLDLAVYDSGVKRQIAKEVICAYFTALVQRALVEARSNEWIDHVKLCVPVFDSLVEEKPQKFVFPQSSNRLKKIEFVQELLFDVAAVLGIKIEFIDAHLLALRAIQGVAMGDNHRTAAFFVWRKGFSSCFSAPERAPQDFPQIYTEVVNTDELIQASRMHALARNGWYFSHVGIFGAGSVNDELLNSFTEIHNDGNNPGILLHQMPADALKTDCRNPSFKTESILNLCFDEGVRDFSSHDPQQEQMVTEVWAGHDSNELKPFFKKNQAGNAPPAMRLHSSHPSEYLRLFVVLAIHDKSAVFGMKLPLDQFDNDNDYMLEVREKGDGAIYLSARAGVRTVALEEMGEAERELFLNRLRRRKEEFTRIESELLEDGSYSLTIDESHKEMVVRRRKLAALRKKGSFHLPSNNAQMALGRK